MYNNSSFCFDVPQAAGLEDTLVSFYRQNLFQPLVQFHSAQMKSGPFCVSIVFSPGRSKTATHLDYTIISMPLSEKFLEFPNHS